MVRRPARRDNVIFTFAAGPKGMKQTDRMKEWRQTIVVICTVLLTFAALAAYMQFELAAMRADMNAQNASIGVRRPGLSQSAAIRA